MFARATGAAASGAQGIPGPPGPYAECPHCHVEGDRVWIRGHYIPAGAPVPPGTFPDARPGTPGAAPPDSPEGKAAAAKYAAADKARRRKAREGKRVLEWCGKRSKCDGKYPSDERDVDQHKPLKWFSEVGASHSCAYRRVDDPSHPSSLPLPGVPSAAPRADACVPSPACSACPLLWLFACTSSLPH